MPERQHNQSHREQNSEESKRIDATVDLSKKMQSGASAADERELRRKAEDEADLKLANADGEGRTQRLQNAYAESLQQLKSLTQQYQRAQQNFEQGRTRLRDLGRTLRKFRETDSDVPVWRDYPGGFTFEVQGDEREECIEDLHEAVGEQRETIRTSERRQRLLEQKREIVVATLQEFERRAETDLSNAERGNARNEGGQVGGPTGGRR